MPAVKPPRFVYTPMHGVGLKIFDSVMDSLGFRGAMYPVRQQVRLFKPSNIGLPGSRLSDFEIPQS